MKNIVLVCAAGMSTSMLVRKMLESAKSNQIEVTIEAFAVSEAKNRIKEGGIDVVMLGPQVRYQKAEIEAVTEGVIPVLVIDMKDYGKMDGQAVLKSALSACQ